MKQMIINASELLPDDAMDNKGDPITKRTKLVNYYEELLLCTSTGQMQLHLLHYLNDKQSCSSVLPLSTCMAIFSLLSCYHLAAATNAMTDQGLANATAMHLIVSKGMGLNELDFQKAMKLALQAPPDIYTLGKQIGVFSVLCGALFGSESDVVQEVEAILNLMKHKAVYKNAQAADPLFAMKMVCLIDHCIQLYLGECIKANSPEDVPMHVLAFGDVQRQVLEGWGLEFKPVPWVIQEQLDQLQLPEQSDSQLQPTTNEDNMTQWG